MATRNTWRCSAAHAVSHRPANTWLVISTTGMSTTSDCGFCAISRDKSPDAACSGIWMSKAPMRSSWANGLHTQYWGRGLATEIATELLRLGREQLHRPTLVAITRPENHGSQRVLGKIGLVVERQILYDGVQHLLFRSTLRAPARPQGLGISQKSTRTP